MNPSVNSTISEEEADAVLTAFAQARAASGGAALSEWSAQFPAHARDLAQLAAQSWAESETEVAAPESVAHLRSIGLAALRACRPEPKTASVITFSASAVSAPITSLLAAAKAAGSDADGVAASVGLPVALFWKLHRRLISPDSVPRALVEALADSINRTLDDVAAYLRMPPQLAAGASFRSDAAPQIGEQETFADALLSEPEVTEAQRQRWLPRDAG